MKVYFDTEFTGLHKNTDLISIGLIAENGDAFYAELNDYDKSQVDEWLDKNVIRNLILNNDSDKKMVNVNTDIITMSGNKMSIRTILNEWLMSFGTDIQFVSDCCHYDMVLLIDLLADNALSINKNFSANCIDINQSIARILRNTMINNLRPYHHVKDSQVFDLSREDICIQILLDIVEVITQITQSFSVEELESDYGLLASNFKQFCYYRNQIIRELIKGTEKANKTSSMLYKFVNILTSSNSNMKHNSLFDAYVIYYIDKFKDVIDSIRLDRVKGFSGYSDSSTYYSDRLMLLTSELYGGKI